MYHLFTVSVRFYNVYMHSHSHCTICCSTATYDVQDPHVESLGGGEIKVTANFVDDSRAVGCFLAIQCNITTEIRFIALKRRDREQEMSETISLPPSNYTVYAHDLEEGAVINTHPANLDPNNVPMVNVTGTSKCFSVV